MVTSKLSCRQKAVNGLDCIVLLGNATVSSALMLRDHSDAKSPLQSCQCLILQVANNKRYAAASGKGFTVTEVADQVSRDSGKIDILVHSLANGPEVTKPLLETSRRVSSCFIPVARCTTQPCLEVLMFLFLMYEAYA